jgi:hypothetical protein
MKYYIYILLFLQLNVNSQTCNNWSTYLGAIGSDEIKGLALDNNKNCYIIMQTDSPSLTTTPGLISNTNNGVYDAYIAKFDSCGNFIWGTYLGTTSFDTGEKIILCPDGNLAFTGYTQGAGLPTTPSCFQSTLAGQYDCFLGKITPNGNLLWLTYFGKLNGDFAYDLSCDFNGNIFMGGTTTSTNFFTNVSSFQQVFGGNTDAFIAKFSKDGMLKWSTYYGGLGVEDIHVLTTDVFGNVFGSGGTNSFNLNTSPGCIQSSLDALRDCYIIKFDSLGNRIFSSYLGGVGQDDAFGLATDGLGNLYMGGQTSSTNFTTTISAYQPTLVGMTDMFLTKISPIGNLLYSTLIGGTDDDVINRMKMKNNEIYLFGTTASTNFPMLGTSNYSVLPGFYNLVIIRLSSSGQPNYSTYFGSPAGYDFGNDIAITNNHLFFCGKSSSSTYPITSNAFQPIYGFNDDGILTKLQNNNSGIITSANLSQLNTEEIIVYPNPTAGKLEIIGANLNGGKFEVLNFLGQLVKQVESTNSEINVEELPEGIYFLRINSSTYKFIKAN